MPDFIEIQRTNFFYLLEKGIIFELQRLGSIESEEGDFKFRFKPESIFFTKPRFSTTTAICHKRTYSCSLYVWVECTYAKRLLRKDDYSLAKSILKTNKVKLRFGKAEKQTKARQIKTNDAQRLPRKKLAEPRSITFPICLGQIPILTAQGHFIINGSPRVVVSQLIRNPGVYFSSTFHRPTLTKLYQASFISNQGSWLRLEYDPKGYLWAKLNKLKKVPIFIFLRAIGLPKRKMAKILKFKYKGIEESELSLNLRFFENQDNDEFIRAFASPYFYNQEDKNSTFDALLAYYSCIYPERYSDDPIRIRGLLEKDLFNFKRYDLGIEGRRQLNHKLQMQKDPTDTVLRPEDILVAVKYIINLKCCNIGEEDDVDHLKHRRVRPVGELVQKQLRIGLRQLEINIERKLEDQKYKQISRRFLNRSRPFAKVLQSFFGSSPLSQYMDQTNPLAELTHKRRLTCLGPGGLKKDHASILVREIHPSHYGRVCPIETPEGLNAGLVNSLATYSTRNNEGFLMTPLHRVLSGKKQTAITRLAPRQEELYFISPGDLSLSSKNEIIDKLVPMRIQQNFENNKKTQIDFMGVSPIQMMSVGTSLIPFLEHNDANRALMASNMQRQAVPLLQVESPIVRTGLEGKTARDSRRTRITKSSGIVTFVSNEKISIQPIPESEEFYVKAKPLRSKSSPTNVTLTPPNVAHHTPGDSSGFRTNRKSETQSYMLNNYMRSNQDTYLHERPVVKKHEILNKGDLLADNTSTNCGELALGTNLLIAYMPWEGYNFEDAIIISERLVFEGVYSHIHIEKYEMTLRTTFEISEKIARDFPGHRFNKSRLDGNGIIKYGSWVEGNDVLIGKALKRKKSQHFSPYKNLLLAIYGKKPSDLDPRIDTSVRTKKDSRGRVIGIYSRDQNRVFRIYVAQIKKIRLGDKISGRHGNKGILSKIVAKEDMPFLQDGTPVDMILSPLGVPSRMNIGQILESLLGLAGKVLHEHYKLMPFDEMYGEQTSRGFVYKKLYEARRKTNKKWLFNPNFPGKSYVFDGRTGNSFEQPVTVGYSYMLKLIHIVDKKMHARAIGPYATVTQQPLRGKKNRGGQRMGEMEVWALEGFGAAYTLQEILTLKSDDRLGRNKLYKSLITGNSVPRWNTSESTKLLIRELNALCLHIKLFDNQPLQNTEISPLDGRPLFVQHKY